MRVDSISEITVEQAKDLYDDYSEPTELLLGAINELIRSYNLLGNKRISLTDNVDCDVRTVSVKGGSEIRVSRSKLTSPRQVVVGRVKTTGTAPTAAVQVLDWRVEGKDIIITNIVGLTASQAYDLTLTIYY